MTSSDAWARTMSRRSSLIGLGALGLTCLAPLSPGAAHTPGEMVGDIRVIPLSDGYYDVPLAAFTLPPEAPPHPDPMVRLGAHAWLIETGARRILVDAGAGTMLRVRHPYSGQLPGALAHVGVSPTDITDIIITHMHADHIGGLMDGGIARFPNAMLHLSAAEWQYWTAPERAASIRPALRPMAWQIAAMADAFAYRIAMHDGTTDIGPGVWTEPAPGHSPGHQIVHVTSGSDSLLLLGDTLVCGALQFEHPQIPYALDANPELAAATRTALFDRIASDDIRFAATHLQLGVPHRLIRRGRNRFEAVHNS